MFQPVIRLSSGRRFCYRNKIRSDVLDYSTILRFLRLLVRIFCRMIAYEGINRIICRFAVSEGKSIQSLEQCVQLARVVDCSPEYVMLCFVGPLRYPEL